MSLTRKMLLMSAAAPLAASFFVLDVARVSERVWMTHLVLIGCAGLLAVVGEMLDRHVLAARAATVILLVVLLGIATPLFAEAGGPHRWIGLGSLNLYVAPVLLPALFAAASFFVRSHGKRELVAVAAIVCVAVLLAVQPDASQTLALCFAALVLLIRYRSSVRMLAIAAVGMVSATAWAFLQPDPLQPVPHVEGVFALVLGHSLVLGVAVIGSAIALIAGLGLRSLRGPPWLLAVVAYYAVLFGCSVAGLTPAPLIGFGAGPLLGFGLLTAISGWFESASRDLDR